jgi:hypothetical protein
MSSDLLNMLLNLDVCPFSRGFFIANLCCIMLILNMLSQKEHLWFPCNNLNSQKVICLSKSMLELFVLDSEQVKEAKLFSGCKDMIMQQKLHIKV